MSAFTHRTLCIVWGPKNSASRMGYPWRSTSSQLLRNGQRSNMALDDLVDVISSLQERMEKYGAELRENETRTRMAIVDPMLSALGWNTADPALVRAEYRVADGKADYALLGPDPKPVACIEAKRLGESLEKHRSQMLNYCNVGGIQFAGLTDGNHWELYEVFSPKPLGLDERRRLDLTISDLSPAECALKLLLLWRPNLSSGQPMVANPPIVGIQSDPPLPPPPPPIDEIPKPPWVPLSKYDPPSKTPPPSHIRLPNGDVHDIEKWYDILLRVAQWLWSSRKLTENTVPVSSSAKRYVLNTGPRHPDGTPFRSPVAVPSSPLSMEAHRSAASSRSEASKLLKHFGADPSSVWVRQSG